jgi:hypothetical protein
VAEMLAERRERIRRRLRPELMRPVLAFRIQERAYGGHSAQLCADCRRSPKDRTPGSRVPDEASNCYKEGTRIIREWGGKIHEVVISAAGYEYEGSMRSLRLEPEA